MKTYNKAWLGSIKARDYAFDIGEYLSISDLTLSKEHGAYIVQGLNIKGQHVDRGFRTLKDCKAFIKDQAFDNAEQARY